MNPLRPSVPLLRVIATLLAGHVQNSTLSNTSSHGGMAGKHRPARSQVNEAAMGSRSQRDWPSGIRECSKCGRKFKQLRSLANHVPICTGKRPVPSAHPGYPPEFQKLIDAIRR